METGRKIAELRAKQNISQAELADRLFVFAAENVFFADVLKIKRFCDIVII